MSVGFLFQYANGGCCAGDGICSIFSWWFGRFRDYNRFQRPAVSMGKKIAALQLFCEPGCERLLMVTDKIVCQIIDGEVFKEQAFGQRAEVRFQPSDYL